MSRIFPVFEGDGASNLPRYPTANDMGGLQFEDDPQYRPQEGKRPRAENYMQLIMAADRVCRMIPTLVVEFMPGASPDVPTIITVTSVIDAITFDTVSISRGGVGIYRIFYPQNALPPKRQMAQISYVGSTAISRGALVNQASGYTDVTLYDNLGNATDNPLFMFKLRLFGE